jgi:hypothetical protein
MKMSGKEHGTKHIGRKSGRNSQSGITVFHKIIHQGKVFVPKPLHGFPNIGWNESWIWIIFWYLIQEKLLVGGMSAKFNR